MSAARSSSTAESADDEHNRARTTHAQADGNHRPAPSRSSSSTAASAASRSPASPLAIVAAPPKAKPAAADNSPSAPTSDIAACGAGRARLVIPIATIIRPNAP